MTTGPTPPEPPDESDLWVPTADGRLPPWILVPPTVPAERARRPDAVYRVEVHAHGSWGATKCTVVDANDPAFPGGRPLPAWSSETWSYEPLLPGDGPPVVERVDAAERILLDLLGPDRLYEISELHQDIVQQLLPPIPGPTAARTVTVTAADLFDWYVRRLTE
jgi:hypothetical protein